MIQREFTVVFTNWNTRKVWAFHKNEAIILAKAEQIKDGLGYNVAHVKNDENKVV